jgi:hypothetical protein
MYLTCSRGAKNQKTIHFFYGSRLVLQWSHSCSKKLFDRFTKVLGEFCANLKISLRKEIYLACPLICSRGAKNQKTIHFYFFYVSRLAPQWSQS